MKARARTNAKNTKVKLSPRLSPVMVECAMSDLFGAKMQVQDVAKKYGVHRITISKWAKKNEHLKAKYEKFEPEPILMRQNKPELERLDLLSQDSMSVMELSLAIVRKRLEDELSIDQTVQVPENAKIKMNELSVIISQIAPFVLPRKEGKGNPDRNRGKKLGLARQMFKQAK